MLVAVGTHFDLRKDQSKPREQRVSVEYTVGTWINLWALRRERFAQKFTLNLLATA